MKTVRRVTAVLVVLLAVPVLILAQSTPVQPQRPGMSPGQIWPAPTQPPGSDLGGVPPPSRGLPAPSQPPQAQSVPEQQRHWGGHPPGWDRSEGRGWDRSEGRQGWGPPPGWYDPYYPPGYPYYPSYPSPAARAVWVPGHWVWTGYTWAWQPGYWARY